MSLNLSKGQNLNLTKTNPTLTRMLLGLGWDVRVTSGAQYDLDVSVYLLNSDGKLGSEADVIFFNQKTSRNSAVILSEDNRTGAGNGDDEQVAIDLTKIPADVQRIVFAVNIYDGQNLKQNFGSVRNAYIRMVDQATNTEVTRYDLSEDASTNVSMIFAELYLHQGDWKFKAIGDGFEGGLGQLIDSMR